MTRKSAASAQREDVGRLWAESFEIYTATRQSLRLLPSSTGLAASHAGLIGFVSMEAATAVAYHQQQTPAMQEEAAIVIRAMMIDTHYGAIAANVMERSLGSVCAAKGTGHISEDLLLLLMEGSTGSGVGLQPRRQPSRAGSPHVRVWS